MHRLLPDPGPLDGDTELAGAYRLPAGRHLRVNFVASLDGAISVDGRSGGLGSPGDRRVFQTLRALSDAVLVGAGTAAAEGYRPVLPDSAVGRLRSVLGRPPVAPVAVVSRRASLSPVDQLVTDAVVPTLLVTCAAADPDQRAALAAAGVVVLVCGDDDVDLPTALDALAERGHEQVLCEGGPALFAAALAAGVVDELDLSIAPLLVGGGAGLLPAVLPSPAGGELVQLLTEDDVLFTRWALR
ncbi:dihydrofolate reductase family protein [Modestobacter sp. VKM Ac-2986]|uniref:dihydrofolate reductase family protein n=1 Tax=Modestobacter sp. VKM Ac-2986 TaxID=3004140 RepID=UPI0022AB8667|nr:dihydrofolate reductase family protein [Modestobacter sp. VKM Ac-2986]MCZ2830568.1 dihydrofolate reductase family protein [Modestobacter sp. VKM Ac-2986]